jgi:16S rRNA (cytosine967-C5)-methyltransferase
MIKRPYREHHLLELLYGYEQQTLPLDRYISDYFRANKALGSKDRGEIAETAYALIRWQILMDWLIGQPTSWEKRLDFYKSHDLTTFLNDVSIPQHVRLSFPEDLYNLIAASLGETANEVCLASNYPAPTTVRINSMKTNRDEQLHKWLADYEVAATQHSPNGINFIKKVNFYVMPEFKEGIFEVQDEGSQLLAGLVNAKPGDLVMDYCSGSGGKTLAFAPAMQNKGQIYLHDVRPYVLEECRKRLRRAGIQNAQVVLENDPKLKKLKKKMDWVLADVPCSGTGTLRRNPDMKQKITSEMVQRLQGQQRMIFEKALSYLKPGGRIVYGTCSLLRNENQDQIAHFMKTYHLELEGEIFQSLPKSGGMDGFFGVVLKASQEKTPELI